jgi:flagellar FliL protein
VATAKPRRGGADEAGESASEGADSVPTDPKKSRLVLWIILALALIAVGGGGLWFWLSAGSSAENEAEAAPAPLPLQFFSLDPPFVANFEGNQEYRFLQVTVRIATRDTQLITLLRDNEPILRNDLLMLFSNQQASVLSSLEGKEALRDDATRVLRESIESLAGDPEQLERVLFTSLVMQ